MIKDGVMKSTMAKIGMLFAKPVFMDIKEATNPDKQGGAPLLGVRGVTVISHGKSSPNAMYNAVRVARAMVKTSMNDKIAQEAARLAEVLREEPANEDSIV